MEEGQVGRLIKRKVMSIVSGRELLMACLAELVSLGREKYGGVKILVRTFRTDHGGAAASLQDSEVDLVSLT
jgi:hypothetical protein